MGWFSEVALSNAAVASLMAAVAWCVSRSAHRPALVHSLWLLVLLKLVTPPIIPLKLAVLAPADLPPAAAAAVTESPPFQTSAPAATAELSDGTSRPGATAGLSGRASHPTERVAPPATKRPSLRHLWHAIAAIPAWLARHSHWLFTGWAVGSGGWIVLTLVRISRQRRMLRLAAPAPLWLQLEADQLARQIGLGNRLRLWLMPGPVSPMIWSFGGTTRLLFPRSLIGRLTPAGRQTLLLHELAHLRRRDHWVRWLEITATCIFWWHPAVWLARSELHVAEEECCDAWVVTVLPDRARAYAAALLETVDFLSITQPVLPVAASGLGTVGCLKRRLANILRGTTRGRLTPSSRAGVVAVGVVVLSVLPTLVEVRPPRMLASTQPRAEVPVAAATQNDRRIQDAAAPAVSPRSDRSEFGVPAVINHLSDFSSTALAFSPDGRTLTAVSPLGSATQVDVASGEFLSPLTTLQRARAIEYAPDGRSIYIADRNNVLRAVHAETGEPFRTLGRHAGAVLDMAVSRDGRQLATAGADGTVRIWTVDGARKPLTFRQHADRVEAVCFSPDGRTVASVSRDGTAYLWRAVNGSIERVLGGAHRTPTYQTQSPQRRVIERAPLIPIGTGGAIMGAIQSNESAAQAAALGAITSRGADSRSTSPTACGSSFSVAFSPDGTIVASAGWNRTVQLWDARNGDSRGALSVERGCITCLAFSPEGDLVATGGREGDLHLWNVARRRVTGTVKAHDGAVDAIAFSPGGAWIATAGIDRMTKLWSVPSPVAH